MNNLCFRIAVYLYFFNFFYGGSNVYDIFTHLFKKVVNLSFLVIFSVLKLGYIKYSSRPQK